MTTLRSRSGPALGTLSDMDLRLLQVFKCVVECGGMAAAELELNVGLSTVSRHVKDLETRLGLTLCRRGRTGFALTPEGERVYEETLRLLASADVFRAGIDSIHQRMGGRLDIAIFDKTASNPAARLAEAIALFSDRAPEVSLNLHVKTIGEIERGIINGTFEVGIIPSHRHSRTLRYATLFDEKMHLYCGARHPLFGANHTALDWDHLRGYAFAGLGYHSPNMAFAHRARLTRKATGYDQEAIATLILSGGYLGFLPDHYASGFERDGRMQAVRPEVFRYTCEFISLLRRSPAPPRAALAFEECLLASHRATRPN